jgi:type I restriction enzyme S subunit
MCAISGKSEAELEQMAEDDFAELQATAALFPDELVESELGEVPKGWDKYSLSKMITLIGGGTPKRSEPNYWNGDIFWFSVKDVPNEGEVFVITTQEKISELGLNKSSTKLLL